MGEKCGVGSDGWRWVRSVGGEEGFRKGECVFLGWNLVGCVGEKNHEMSKKENGVGNRVSG